MKRLLTILILSISMVVYSQDMKKPIIDIHLHGYSSIPPNVKASWAGETYAQELTSPQNTEMHLQMVIEEMKKNNIKLGVISSTSVEALTKWKTTAPESFLSGIQTDELGQPILSPDSLKILFEKGEVDILGELGLQYFGLEPDVPMMAPYYKIAEENGIPVCLHTGLGPPGGPHSFAPKFRTTLGKPTLFEPILVKHPNLKAFLAHAGYPYIEETIAMMYIYPKLYADIGVLTWALPVEAFYSTLKHLMDAGFGRRIMFGSDQMMWPGAITIAVKTVEEAPFLSESEKRDILYNNAARFLELDPELISSHHK
ncbi:amidohydrolase family protein [uncultured Eudoraea sp.]|uniref:amidohydrolase family protein n=1 Tax=uncultured Eudoraea sp. TaxID=1035614 RepID=UPI00262FAA5C|nr:amidohydrolase family protein [uncultured Eudoraea sp.]